MSSYEFLGSLSAAELVQLKQEINAVDLGVEIEDTEQTAPAVVIAEQICDLPF